MTPQEYADMTDTYVAMNKSGLWYSYTKRPCLCKTEQVFSTREFWQMHNYNGTGTKQRIDDRILDVPDDWDYRTLVEPSIGCTDITNNYFVSIAKLLPYEKDLYYSIADLVGLGADIGEINKERLIEMIADAESRVCQLEKKLKRITKTARMLIEAKEKKDE